MLDPLISYRHSPSRPKAIRPVPVWPLKTRHLVTTGFALLATAAVVLINYKGDPPPTWAVLTFVFGLFGGLLSLAAGIFLELYTSGQALDNQKLARWHRQRRHAKLRRQRRKQTNLQKEN